MNLKPTTPTAMQLLRMHCLILVSLLISTASVRGDPFVPGSGDPIPDLALTETPGRVGGLFVRYNHRQNLYFGNGDRAEIEFEFPAPSEFGATGYRFQISADGTIWEDLPDPQSDGWFETSSDTQERKTLPYPSFEPRYYRFRVLNGPKDGAFSNEEAIQASDIDTRFAGWGLDTSMWITGTMIPWVGHGLEASFTVRTLADNSDVAGALSYQWYRVHPHTYEKTLIPGADGPVYVTTPDDVGGWLLMCQGTGDEVNAGGFARVIHDWGVLIPNPSFASESSRDGFRMHLERSVPSLVPEDLVVSYYNDSWEEVVLPVTAVTPVEGMAVFDVAVSVPMEVDYLTVSNVSDVWQLVTQFSPQDMVRGLTIELPPAASFDDWVDGIPEIPVDRRAPEDHNGPLDLVNLLAYAMGLNPLTALPEDLPQVTGVDGTSMTVRFRRAIASSNAEIVLQTSPDLSSWQPATVLGTTLLETADGSELVEVEIPAPSAGRGFFRLDAIAVGLEE